SRGREEDREGQHGAEREGGGEVADVADEGSGHVAHPDRDEVEGLVPAAALRDRDHGVHGAGREEDAGEEPAPARHDAGGPERQREAEQQARAQGVERRKPPGGGEPRDEGPRERAEGRAGTEACDWGEARPGGSPGPTQGPDERRRRGNGETDEGHEA